MRTLALVVACCCLLQASAFVSPGLARSSAPSRTCAAPLRMTSKKEGGPIVSVNKENVEFGAGVVGGLTGLVVGGPILALILSIAANYGSKQENDVGEAVRGVSKGAISAFNFLAGVNDKYDVTGKATEALGEAVDKLKETDDSKSLEKVEVTLKEATTKAKKLADEYDLLAKGKQALGVVGDLADTAIEKTVELEKEYKVVDKAVDSVKKAVKNASD